MIVQYTSFFLGRPARNVYEFSEQHGLYGASSAKMNGLRIDPILRPAMTNSWGIRITAQLTQDGDFTTMKWSAPSINEKHWCRKTGQAIAAKSNYASYVVPLASVASERVRVAAQASSTRVYVVRHSTETLEGDYRLVFVEPGQRLVAMVFEDYNSWLFDATLGQSE